MWRYSSLESGLFDPTNGPKVFNCYCINLPWPSTDTCIHQQPTCKVGKVFLQVRRLDFVSQDVSLVEEEDNGGVVEPGRMDGGVE